MSNADKLTAKKTAVKPARKTVVKESAAVTAEQPPATTESTAPGTSPPNAVIETSGDRKSGKKARAKESPLPKKKSTPPSDLSSLPPRWLVAQAATQLVAAQLASANQPGPLLPLDDPSYDCLFEAAKRRAESLLRPPVEDESIVYAEQIFDQEEIISENQVGERFKNWDWPTLKNREPLVELMRKVSGWFVSYLEKQEEQLDARFDSFSTVKSRFVRAIFNYCGSITGLDQNRPWPEMIENIARRIEQRVDEWYFDEQGYDQEHMECLHELLRREYLIRCCFADSDSIPTDRKTKKNLTRLYRPWGLFRYLRLYGNDDPVGTKLNEKLCAKKRLLNDDFKLSELLCAAVYPYTIHDFGHLDNLVEKRFEEVSSKQEIEFQKELMKSESQSMQESGHEEKDNGDVSKERNSMD